MTAYGPPAWSPPPAPEPEPIEPPYSERPEPPERFESSEPAPEPQRPDALSDHDAEREVLAAILVSPALLEDARSRLMADDWHDPHHRGVWQAMCAVADAEGDPADLNALLRELTAIGKRPATAWMQAFAVLSDRAGTTRHFGRYVAAVAEASQRRQVKDLGEWAAAEAAQGPEDHGEWLEKLQAQVTRIAEARAPMVMRDSPTVLRSTLDQIERAGERGGALTGVSTGLRDVDAILGGLRPGELLIVAARPAMGKTAFGVGCVTHTALASDMRWAVFSLEMPAESLMLRQISSQALIDMERLRTGRLSDDDWPRMVTASDDLRRQPTQWADSTAANLRSIRAECARLQRNGGLDGVMVDYLQLMQGSRGVPREQQIAQISRGLKALALELGVCVIAISQLNRGPEQRGDKRPMMADLRESGAIEQDADIIVFLYRDEVYNKASDAKGIAEVIVAKQRNGPIGTARVRFDAPHVRFFNLSSADEYRVGSV